MKTAARLVALTTVLIVGIAPGVASAAAGDPQAVIVSPADGTVLPQGANVQFGFFCASDTSFVVSCDGSQPLGSSIDTTNAGTHTLSVTATDFDGRTTTATATYTVLDLTPPHVDFRVPADGATYAQGASLAYDYGCADDAGGLGIQACIAGNTSTLGSKSFGVDAYDNAGNESEAKSTYSVVYGFGGFVSPAAAYRWRRR